MKQREHEVLQQLSQADLRITPQRRCLVQEILRLPEHFSADELLDHMRGEGNRVSRATLYRLLPALVQIGVLREVLYGEEHSHYEVVYEEDKYHGHLICERCGQVIDFICPAVEGAIIGVSREHNFVHHAHTLEITGLCEQCQQAES